MTRRHALLTAAALAATVVAVNLPALRSPLFWDDHVYRFFVLELSFPETLCRGLFGAYFRPLGTVLWWCEARLFGAHVIGYHLVSLVLHLVNTALVAVLLVRTRPGSAPTLLPPLAAAALFALNPVASATTAWAANVVTLLATALGLGGIVASTWQRLSTTVTPVLLLAAIASKEDGVVFLVPALVIVWRSTARPGRRIAATLLLLAAPAVALGWRMAAIGLGAGLVDLRQGVAPGVAAAVLGCLLVAVAAASRVRRPDLRLGLVLVLPAAALAVALTSTLPPLPYGLHLRIFYPTTAAACLVAGAVVAAVGQRRPRWQPAVLIALVATTGAGVAGSTTHLRRWRTVTEASADLVSRVAGALDARGALHGPVWVTGEADEIALDPAVKLLRPALTTSLVLLRPVGLSFVAAPPVLWPAVAREVTVWKIPGNPAVAADWVAAAVFPRSDRFRAAVAGRSGVPVVAPSSAEAATRMVPGV